jgi:hypothetical protein
MGKIRRCLLGAFSGYAIYLLIAWSYIAIVRKITGGSPDTFPPFVWPFESPFLIFRDSWQGPPLDENLLSLVGGLLLIAGALWGYLDFPRKRKSEIAATFKSKEKPK